MIELELQAHCLSHPEASKWFKEVHRNNDSLIDIIADIPVTDHRRLAALNPTLLRRVVKAQHGVHLSLANTPKPIQDMILIQRSQASILPVSEGDPVSLRGLFKKTTKKTAIVERTPSEEIEYQFFHRDAAQ
jgi:hypothetical protein